MIAANESSTSKLLRGSIAMVREPKLDSEIEQLRLLVTTLALALGEATDLLETVQQFSEEPEMLTETILSNRALIKQAAP